MKKLIRVALLCVLFAATPALAQGNVSRTAYEAARQEMLNKPADPATLLHFADVAAQDGDFKGAISALERLLLLDPGHPRVRLELAVLYLRIGKNDAAKAYLDSVLTSPRATAEVREEARALQGQADARLARSQFTGDFLVGLQYSSNANSGASGQVLASGIPVVPSPNISRTPDWGVIAGGLLHHRYDLQTADLAAIESDLALYATRQFTVSTANVLLADLTTGPRFALAQGSVDGLTARPFLTGRYVSQHDLPTYWAYGSGVELRKDLGATAHASATVLGRRREFQNNADSPTNSQSSGNEIYGTLSFEFRATSWLTFLVGGSATRFSAAVSSQSYQEYGTGLTAIFAFDDPLGFNGRQWTVTLGGSAAFAGYDAPDPSVDPSTTRTQRDLIGSLLVTVPLDERLMLVAQATYTDRAASVANYAYNAATTLVGVSWHF